MIPNLKAQFAEALEHLRNVAYATDSIEERTQTCNVCGEMVWGLSAELKHAPDCKAEAAREFLRRMEEAKL